MTNGTDADLWAHEWNKHGTCMSTLLPSCYSDYAQAQEVVDYFDTTAKLSRSLPTFSFLERCGIVPSDKTTYALADIEHCLAEATGGYTPHLGCSTDGLLNEVWYYHHLAGSIRDGSVVGTNSTFPSTCPKNGIKYLPKVVSKYA